METYCEPRSDGWTKLLSRSGRHVQGLLQRIEHEVGVHRTTDRQPTIRRAKDVDDEGHVQQTELTESRR